MKKVIVGAVLFMSGTISAFLLLGGAMAYRFEHINVSPFVMTLQILAKYDFTPFLYAAAAIAGTGMVLAALGLEEKAS